MLGLMMISSDAVSCGQGSTSAGNCGNVDCVLAIGAD